MKEETRKKIIDKYLNEGFLHTTEKTWLDETIALLLKHDEWLSRVRGVELDEGSDVQIKKLCVELVKWREMAYQSHTLFRTLILLINEKKPLTGDEYVNIYKDFLWADKNFDNCVRAAEIDFK